MGREKKKEEGNYCLPANEFNKRKAARKKEEELGLFFFNSFETQLSVTSDERGQITVLL